MKETSKTVIKYLQSLAPDAHVTAADVAEATELTTRQVNAIFSFSIAGKGYGQRVDAMDSEGNAVKLLELNAEGRAFDCDAEPVKPVEG